MRGGSLLLQSSVGHMSFLLKFIGTSTITSAASKCVDLSDKSIKSALIDLSIKSVYLIYIHPTVWKQKLNFSQLNKTSAALQ